MAKTCKEWIRTQLKENLSGYEFEVKTKGRNKADWLFENEDRNAIIIEDKESTDTNIEKAIIQVHKYGEEVLEKYKNIITIAVKELSNGEHQVAVFVNGKRLEKHPKNDLNTLDWYWHLLEPKFDRDLLSKNISSLNNKMHKMKIADNIRASIASTFLVCINKHMELSESDDIETIKNKVYKSLQKYTVDESGQDLNKWQKIRSLYDRFSLDLQKEESYLNPLNLFEIWKMIKFEIYEYIKNAKTEGYDVMSLFFTTFSRAALSNDKGQYFTPDHISSLMCDLLNLNINSKVLDPTCGSGTFLAKCMDKMISLANENEKKIRDIKQNQIFGIEFDKVVYGLATANMLLHKDGKSNVENGDCFNILPKLGCKNIDRLIMNPPYSMSKKNKDDDDSDADRPELDFLIESLNIMQTNGIATIIIPTSCALGTKWKEQRIALMNKHTLKAVMTCPNDLFYPTAVNTCIMVWESHVPHHGKTYLANWKNDGFTKKRLGKKNTVRVSDPKEWNVRKNIWINNYKNGTEGLLVDLTPEDSWLYESHMEIDYTKLQQRDFEKTVNDYLAFLISNKGKI